MQSLSNPNPALPPREAFRVSAGTTIGMSGIKQRRLTLPLTSHPTLSVGQCVPFYFCPRSVMLYVLHRANDPDLQYRGGQEPILHLETDLMQTIAWAEENGLRWAFTLSNAGSNYFEDRADLQQLSEIDWDAVKATDWKHCKEGKQAEFLIESRFPWELVSKIGVASKSKLQQTLSIIRKTTHQPRVEIQTDWYYELKES